MVDDDGLIRLLMAIEKGFLLGKRGFGKMRQRSCRWIYSAAVLRASAGNRETGSKTDVSDDIFN